MATTLAADRVLAAVPGALVAGTDPCLRLVVAGRRASADPVRDDAVALVADRCLRSPKVARKIST